MTTSSKEAKVQSILVRETLPESTRKVNYLWQNVNDIRVTKQKIHSNVAKANKSSSSLNFGDQKVFTVPIGKFVSNFVLKLEFVATSSTVAPDMFGCACIEKVEIYHGQKLLEYNGEALAQIFMHYAKDDTWKTSIYANLGGNGATLSAATYTYFVPIFTGLEHPQQMYGKYIDPYSTRLMNSTLDIQITFKTVSNSLKTPDTVTAFSFCELYYLDYWAQEGELQILTKDYSRFMYDTKSFRQKLSFVTGTEKAIDTSSLANDNVEVHDQIFQCVTDTEWSTNKNYNQGTAPTFFRFQVNGIDYFKSSDNNDIKDFTFWYNKKYSKNPYFSQTATSYIQLTDPFTHEIADNYSSTLDEQIITPGYVIAQQAPTLNLKLTTGDYWIICTALRKRVVKYNGNFVQQKF